MKAGKLQKHLPSPDSGSSADRPPLRFDEIDFAEADSIARCSTAVASAARLKSDKAAVVASLGELALHASLGHISAVINAKGTELAVWALDEYEGNVEVCNAAMGLVTLMITTEEGAGAVLAAHGTNHAQIRDAVIAQLGSLNPAS